MTISRILYNFNPVVSTAASFEAIIDNATGAFAMESSSLREWTTPSGRAVRIASVQTDDFHLRFGTSDIGVAGSSDSMLILGGTVETFHPVKPSYTHLSFVSSTTLTINITLGYGA